MPGKDSVDIADALLKAGADKDECIDEPARGKMSLLDLALFWW